MPKLTSDQSFRRCRFRPSCCIVIRTRAFRLRLAMIWRPKFLMQDLSNTPEETTLSGQATPDQCSAISRNLSQDIATIHRANLSGFWRQYFLPTLLIRRAAQQQWAIRLGDNLSTVTTTLRSRWSISTAEIWSRVQATAFWRRSRDPGERSDALWRSGPPHSKSVYRCAQVA